MQEPLLVNWVLFSLSTSLYWISVSFMSNRLQSLLTEAWEESLTSRITEICRCRETTWCMKINFLNIAIVFCVFEDYQSICSVPLIKCELFYWAAWLQQIYWHAIPYPQAILVTMSHNSANHIACKIRLWERTSMDSQPLHLSMENPKNIYLTCS